MIVVPNSDKYYNDVKELIVCFFNEALSEYTQEVNEEAVNKSINECKDNAFLLVKDDKCVGVIAGVSITDPVDGKKIFQESIWYVKEEYRKYGVKLFREAERLLKERGFHAVIMVCLYNSKTEKLYKFYQKLGYQPLETHFIRRL